MKKNVEEFSTSLAPVDKELVVSFEKLKTEFTGDGLVHDFAAVLDKLQGNRFNFFQVLGIADFEIRHSRMLAWLLNPRGNHGLDCRFLNCFLAEIRSKSDCQCDALLRLGSNGSYVRVETEEKHMDIFLEDKDHKIVLVIENKWNAKERKDSEKKPGQLRTYSGFLGKRYRDWNVFKVFLSPSNERPSRPDWLPLGYENVLTCLHKVEKMKCDDKIKHVLGDYQILLEGKVAMETDKFKNECMDLYARYRGVFKYMLKNHLFRDRLLVEFAKGIEVPSLTTRGKPEHLDAATCGAKGYIQFNRRLPPNSSQSVHYEICLDDECAKVCLHIERDTEPSLKDRLKEEIESVMVGCKGDTYGYYYDIPRGEYQNDESEFEKAIRQKFGDVYLACEGVLRKYDKKMNMKK